MTIWAAVFCLTLAASSQAALPEEPGSLLTPLSDTASRDAQFVSARLGRRQAQRRETVSHAPWTISSEDLKHAKEVGPQHALHFEIFDKYSSWPMNHLVLQAVDRVQGQAPDGGGYFTGVHANPPESPVGFPLALGPVLLNPSRKRSTSFCTGASYSAFIGAMNLWTRGFLEISPDRLEALKMEEPDGGRREDGVKFWGRWNADDFGVYYALVPYSGMGTPVKPEDARAGDFMTIGWKGERSHSVVFLGWYRDREAGESMIVWSSQESTNGVGDYLIPLSRVHGVKIVRLTNPAAIASFNPVSGPDAHPTWDRGAWFPPEKAPRNPRQRRG